MTVLSVIWAIRRWAGLAGLALAWLPCPASAQPRVPEPAVVLSDSAPAIQQALTEAARLQAQFKDSDALARYQEVLRLDPNHYHALWEAAVLSIRIGARYSDETRKSAYFDAGRAYADRALALRPNEGESNYAVALALFHQATLRNGRQRLEAYRDLRPYVHQAVACRPDLPETWQLLGRWQYRVAHYNVLERAYSKLVLGEVPAGGSSRAAMQALEQAHALAPQQLQYCYDLARMYRYQGRRRRALAILREAAKIPPATSDELVLSRLCRNMLPPLERQDRRKQRRETRQAAANAGR